MKFVFRVIVALWFTTAPSLSTRPQTLQETLDFFERFFHIPKTWPDMETKAAQISFNGYVENRSGISFQQSPEKPVREALLELWERLPLYADSQFGDKNGTGEVKELQMLKRRFGRHASYKKLKELFAAQGLRYSSWTM